ncbi:DnaJ domain-containing protein [Vibrio sp. JC009]|uniref:DNA-J related domain-containing protein n=1 Tax=Vibrio sp. JC009 TaxID=2912314 RepID=UPI0023B11445|nr:DNA-J related domain-containing protein [Vibrio sp. JC009]WED24393.1 DnaJ domain-containing protein [Vibrio sp. JC009]
MENPLIWPILEILEKQNDGWKVHTLAASLGQLDIMPVLDQSAEKDLFKRNFLIMNALYQLQEDLHPDVYVQVEAMDIRLIRTDINKKDSVSNDDPLRDYYTNWANYEAEEGEVRRLLRDFWTRYRRHVGSSSISVSRTEALRIFELREDAKPAEIRKRWRALALKWHPDRDKGNAEKFRKYCEAWTVLKTQED